MAVLGMLGLLVLAVLINLLFGRIGIGRADSWTATLLVFAIMMVIAGFAGKQRWDGIFIDRDNRISLSRLQLVLWTVLLVSALFTIGLTNEVVSDRPPLDITIPEQIWALLGLGAFTAVAAPAIKDSRRQNPVTGGAGNEAFHTRKTAAHESIADTVKAQQNLDETPVFDGDVLAKQTVRDARWIDLYMGDNEGSSFVDVSKLQQLAFTVLVVTVYGGDIWSLLNGNRGFIGALPPVSDGFLWLLGISHTAYLADKKLAST